MLDQGQPSSNPSKVFERVRKIKAGADADLIKKVGERLHNPDTQIDINAGKIWSGEITHMRPWGDEELGRAATHLNSIINSVSVTAD